MRLTQVGGAGWPVLRSVETPPDFGSGAGRAARLPDRSLTIDRALAPRTRTATAPCRDAEVAACRRRAASGADAPPSGSASGRHRRGCPARARRRPFAPPGGPIERWMGSHARAERGWTAPVRQMTRSAAHHRLATRPQGPARRGPRPPTIKEPRLRGAGRSGVITRPGSPPNSVRSRPWFPASVARRLSRRRSASLIPASGAVRPGRGRAARPGRRPATGPAPRGRAGAADAARAARANAGSEPL
jgi:hypothetical protein